MQTLNIRLAAICLVTVGLVGGGVHLLHAFQFNREADAFRNASDRAKDEKNLKEAIRQLESYVRIRPDDNKAQFDLGLLYVEAHNNRGASDMLEKVLRVGDESLDAEKLREAKRKLVDVNYMMGRLTDAEDRANELLVKTPDDAELRELYGWILIKDRKVPEGCKQLRLVIAKAPSRVSAYVPLASVLRSPQVNRVEEADQCMKLMVANNPKSIEALATYGNYLLLPSKPGGAHGPKSDEAQTQVKSDEAQAQAKSDQAQAQAKFVEALAQAKKILELAPEHPKGLYLAGRCYLAQGLYKDAEDCLNRGIKADKSDAAMYEVLFQVKRQRNQPDEAIAVLRTGLENTKGTPGYASLLWDKFNAEITARKIDSDTARKDLNELRDLRFGQGNQFPPHLLQFGEAELAVVKGEWKTAKTALKDVIPKLQDNPANLKLAYLDLGQCWQQEGNVDEQIVAYTAATEIDPYFVPARDGLANIFLSRRLFGDAAEEYLILYRAGKLDADRAPALARIVIMQTLAREKEKRDWEPVEKLLAEILRQRPMNPNLAVLMAEVQLAKDLPLDAEKTLKDCSLEHPKSAQVWLALINLAMYQADRETDAARKESQWKAASDYIDRAQAGMGDCAITRVARGTWAVHRKDPQAAALLKQLGENLDAKMSDSERNYLWSNLGAKSVQLGDFDMGRSYFRLLASQEKSDIRIRYLLCDLNLQMFEKGHVPDLKEIDRLVDEIYQLGGRGPFWLYCKAIRAFVQSKKPDPQALLAARSDLVEAMGIRKDWAALPVLAGKICELQDEPDQALDFYLRAVRLMGERNSDVIARTVKLLVPRGRLEEAKQLFDFLEKQKSASLDELSDEHRQVMAFVGDPLEAEREIAKSVAPDSKNYKDLLLQGQLYGLLANRLLFKEQGTRRDGYLAPEPKRVAQLAVDCMMKAKSLNPQSDEVWMELVRFLVQIGKPDLARPVVAEAESALKGEQASITLAKCYDIVKETDKAQAKYEAAAKSAPQNSRTLRLAAYFYIRANKLDRAEPLLRQVIAMQSPAAIGDAAWARRALALSLKSRGGFDHLCQAVTLIDDNLLGKAASIEDKRLKVAFLLADPRKQKINEAVQVEEELVKSAAATPNDYNTLAQLYLKKGNWSNYLRAMDAVLGSQTGTVEREQLVAHISALLERRQLDDAEKWLKTLEKTDPDFFTTVQLRAEDEFLHGQYGTARNLALEFLRNPRAVPQDIGQRNLLIAQIMEHSSDQLKAAGNIQEAAGNKQKAADSMQEAAKFTEQADLLFGTLRNPKVAESGEIFYVSYLARQKRFDECLAALERCWDTVPPEDLRYPAVAMLGAKAANSGQLQQMEKYLAAAVKKSSHPVSLLLVLAGLHDELRQYDKTIADYREILAKEPRNFQTVNNLALSLARNGGNLDEALKLIDDALAMAGPMSEMLDSRAIVHIARQEPDKALADMVAAVADDGTAEQYFHLAWAYSLAGKKAEAAAAFAESTKRKLDPKTLDPHEVAWYDRLKSGL